MSLIPDHPEVILPEPKGHRRATLAFVTGIRDAFTVTEAAELAAQLQALLRDPDEGAILVLEDANYGAPYILTKAGARQVVSVGTAWLERVAPQRASKLQIARDLPPGLN